ncbi:MAG: hypothetical protein ABJP06_00775 [Sulfitobacter sp.]
MAPIQTEEGLIRAFDIAALFALTTIPNRGLTLRTLKGIDPNQLPGKLPLFFGRSLGDEPAAEKQG